MSHLFSELRLRGVTLANRIGVSPMCQYSCEDGFANDWHFAHLAARAVGGAGVVFTEAAAVSPEGRISPQDLGVWSDKHFEPLERIARFIKGARRRAPAFSSPTPGEKPAPIAPGPDRAAFPCPKGDGGPSPRAPSRSARASRRPEELSLDRILALQQAFTTAAKRAHAAGFR